MAVIDHTRQMPHGNPPSTTAVPTAYVERKTVNLGTAGRWADQIFNKRVPVEETQQDPPIVTPISTRAWGIGKTFDHAWAHVWPFITLNLQSTPAIQHWHQASIVPKVPSAFVIDMGIGAQNPIVARVNINQPPNMAYGSKVQVAPPAAYYLPANYMKLM